MPLGSGTPPEFDVGAQPAPVNPIGGTNMTGQAQAPVVQTSDSPFKPIGGAPMQPNIPPIMPQNPIGNNSAGLPLGTMQPQPQQPQPQPLAPGTSAAWPVPPNSGVDLSMFIPGPQNIPNGSGGHWPVEFQPVNYDPFAGTRNPASGFGMPADPTLYPNSAASAAPGGPMNNNLTMR